MDSSPSLFPGKGAASPSPQALPTQKEFIEYLSDHAKANRCVSLLVKQVLSGGEYADGTLKATWPAMKSRSPINPEDAIYGNTGLFIESRMPGKPSASKSNCEHCGWMVLDDIGTKSKEPPLDPSWIIETSPGCFQWGYKLADPPTRGAFAAAIRAVADAGFTDPGACNPVRNFRIPGSVNLKPGKNRFVSKLIKFNKDLEYTLEEVCEGIGVTPGEDDSDYRSIKVERTHDEVLNWLSEKGYVYGNANDGWIDVLCPNHENHTEQDDFTARYHKNDRGFFCFHGHCQDLSSSDFLTWVKDNGGPDVQHGSSDASMKSLGGKLDGIDAPESVKNAAREMVAKIDEEQAEKDEKNDLFNLYAYLASDDSYIDIQTRREYSRSAFNAKYRHLGARSKHGSHRLIEASVFYDENRKKCGGEILVGLTYAPGEGFHVVKEGAIHGNKWKNARPAVDKTNTKNISTWLDHGRSLIPDSEDFEHVLNLMAYKLQNPDKKINHAVLHAGCEGCGKDTFWYPFMWGVCGPDNDNRGYLDSRTLNTAWGYHLESEILLINELKEPTAAERHALANNLKPIIAAPPHHLDVNRKGLHPYKALNRTFVLAFSNSRTPISLSPQDRRWFAVWSNSPRMTQEDATRIWKWYENGGVDAVVAWLYRRDVSMFNPAAAPKQTDFKEDMIENGMTSAQAWLAQAIEDGMTEFQNGVVGSPFSKLADRLQGQSPGSMKVHHAAIVDALQDAGWVYLGNGFKSRANPVAKKLWVSKEVYRKYANNEYSKSELRDLAEKATGPKIMRFKSA